MSKLQSAAKPILLPMIHGNWSELDELQRDVLIRWILMFTMVVEFADPKTAVIPQQHRDALRLSRPIPFGWTIWLGEQDDNDDHPGWFNHHGSAQFLSAAGQSFVYAMQSTGFGVGKLMVQTMTFSPFYQREVNVHGFAAHYDLRVLHPDGLGPVLN
jgi:hypothetical protein